jgi:hypothetical protein
VRRTAKKALLCAALSLGALALQHSNNNTSSSGNSSSGSSTSSSSAAAHKFAVTARAHLKEVFDVPSTLTASKHSIMCTTLYYQHTTNTILYARLYLHQQADIHAQQYYLCTYICRALLNCIFATATLRICFAYSMHCNLLAIQHCVVQILTCAVVPHCTLPAMSSLDCHHALHLY